MFKAVLGCFGLTALIATPAYAEAQIPHYDHIFVIILENHSFDEIIGNKTAPTLNKLAASYGLASNFYGEVHPSEGNYVAMVGGDSFGIHDDDAFWCKKGDKDPACPNAGSSDYVDHSFTARSLPDQLKDAGLSWKGYFQDIPAPGSKIDRSAADPATHHPFALYAAKHNGFIGFASVQDDPSRADKLVGFDQLERDLAADALPNFAHIVPNQCDDMHGMNGHYVEEDCVHGNQAGLLARADRLVGQLVDRIMATKSWQSPANSAIVVTFDEGGHSNPTNHAEGCCGAEIGNPSNFGGGWIATLVIANHGPRGVTDPTPYNHYSLLRTTEAAFGINEHLGHAADLDKGVTVMAPLFAAR